MTSVNTSNGGGTQSPQAYMSQHKEIPQLLEYLYHELLVEQPENVIQFLRDRVTKNRPARIIISGPPGAGKGTQCQLLSEALQLTYLSTGVLLREEIRKGTDMGKEAKEFVDRGALVPDQLMLQLVLQRLNTESANNTGWILDGFPRTRPQALALQVHGVFPDLVVLLDIRKEEALRRFSVRRMDPETEKVYILESDSSQSSLLPMPSNEIVQSRLIQRTDETPEIISFRYDTYRRNERDLVACYSSVIQRVDGARISQDIHREVLDLVKILLHSE